MGVLCQGCLPLTITSLWNLDDTAHFVLVLHFTVPWARTWADMRPGHTDREHREALRERAVPNLGPVPASTQWWAVRIVVSKAGGRPFDIENVPKPILDAFCVRQIHKDRSTWSRAGLFEDDSIDHVRILQVFGERGDTDKTRIQIYSFIGSPGHPTQTPVLFA
jgi:hypothetical protein